LKSRGVDDRVLIDAGLSRRGRNGVFDVFRGRLMFPIFDLRGDPVGFGGRKLDGIDRKVTNNPDAKYVNSADSILYHKGSLLFGLDRARKYMTDTSPAVIVEGYTDVIAMHQAGITTAIATCGTALGDGHFDLLRRFSERVVLAFDSDEAGSRAALRGDQLESPFRLDLDLRVAVMPDGLDPADLVQEGRSEELVAAVTTARPLLEHRIDHEVAKYDLEGPEGRARALHSAATELRKVNDRIARREYMRYVARRVGVDLADVESAVEGSRSRRSGVGPATDRPFDRIDVELLRLVLANDGGLGDLTQADFWDQRLREAFAVLEPRIGSTPEGTPLDISDVEPLLQGVLLSLALDDRPLASVEEMSSRVRERRLDAEIAGLQAEMDLLTPGSEPHSAVLQRMMALQREKRTSPGKPA
jgi:DNA primase